MGKQDAAEKKKKSQLRLSWHTMQESSPMYWAPVGELIKLYVKFTRSNGEYFWQVEAHGQGTAVLYGQEGPRLFRLDQVEEAKLAAEQFGVEVMQQQIRSLINRVD